MRSVEEHRRLLAVDESYRDAERERDQLMEFEIRRSIEQTRKRRTVDDDDFDDFDEDDDDEGGVTVVYE
jgi:hypothetical protein